jgi:hypothetical protein
MNTIKGPKKASLSAEEGTQPEAIPSPSGRGLGRGLILLMLICWLGLSATQAMTPLPKGVIAEDSPQGLELMSRTSRSPYFWQLEQQFVTQDNLTYCSIASSVMVLNALGIPGPTDRNYGPYHIFTQQNFFTPSVEKILPKALVQKQGATLNQIAEALSTFKVKVTVIHATESTEADFKRVATSAMKQGDGYIIVNFLRTALGQTGGGHMSPLAAYDKQTDRFLVLDVSRYRYPPVWVKTRDIWKAMNTYDEGAKAYRGFIRVQKVSRVSVGTFKDPHE